VAVPTGEAERNTHTPISTLTREEDADDAADAEGHRGLLFLPVPAGAFVPVLAVA
jgi:hypothetical protein